MLMHYVVTIKTEFQTPTLITKKSLIRITYVGIKVLKKPTINSPKYSK